MLRQKPDLPYRRRQQARVLNKPWWARVWASRSVWALVGSAATWVLANGVESLANLRQLPSELQSTYHTFQSWYYDDFQWTGTWSSRQEGYVDDYKQAELPLKLTIETKRGTVAGEMFIRSVCDLNPLLPPVLVEGEIVRSKLVAYAFAYVSGERNFLFSFTAIPSEEEPVITLSPLRDPLGLMPPSARLVQKIEVEPLTGASATHEYDMEHPDLECPESPSEYLERLRNEGKMKGVDQLRQRGGNASLN